MWVGGQRHDPATLLWYRDPVPIVQNAGWDQRPVWTGAEKIATTGNRSPDRPARSESLYRLSYPGPQTNGLRVTIALLDEKWTCGNTVPPFNYVVIGKVTVLII